jgi:hypothetical protein
MGQLHDCEIWILGISNLNDRHVRTEIRSRLEGDIQLIASLNCFGRTALITSLIFFRAGTGPSSLRHQSNGPSNERVARTSTILRLTEFLG